MQERMMALRAEHTPDVLSDKKIMEHILGAHFVYLSGWERSTNGLIHLILVGLDTQRMRS